MFSNIGTYMLNSFLNSYGSYGSYNSYNTYGPYANRNAVSSIRALQGLVEQRDSTLAALQRAKKNAAKLDSDSADFLKEYQGSMTRLMEAANKLRDTGSAGKTALRASVSDAAVAEVSSAIQNFAGNYTLTVDQVATGQVNETQAIQNASLPSLGGGLTLQTGDGTFNFYLSAAGYDDVKSALDAYASQINSRETGITASVLENKTDNTYRLRLDGTDAGEFTASGSFAQRTGLDQVASTGQKASFTVQAEGEEAQRFTSDTNRIQIDGIDVTLKKAGTTDIKVQRQSGLTADGVQELVDAFNSSLKLLNDNADRGVGVLRQMQRMVQPPASERSLNLAGIGINRDGTLKLDTTRFNEALRRSPSLVQSIVSGSYGLAQGAYLDGQQGLRVSSASLLSNDRLQNSLNTLQNPMNFTSLYSRSGALNMLNYYSVGALMNMSI